MLASLAVAALIAGFGVAGRRSLERKIPGLIRGMNETLGSTDIFGGPDNDPAAGTSGA